MVFCRNCVCVENKLLGLFRKRAFLSKICELFPQDKAFGLVFCNILAAYDFDFKPSFSSYVILKHLLYIFLFESINITDYARKQYLVSRYLKIESWCKIADLPTIGKLFDYCSKYGFSSHHFNYFRIIYHYFQYC